MYPNENNRINDMSPKLLAQLTAMTTAAVQEAVAQVLTAIRKHPEELLEAQETYFGKHWE